MGINNNPCSSCLHNHECMEQRGRCREYKDLKGVMEDIEMLNKKARATKRTNADKTAQGERSAGDMPESFGSARKEAARRDPEATEAGRGD